MAKHKESVIWLVRRNGYPNYNVKTWDNNHLLISVFQESEKGIGFSISRKNARLLAKRINQCLEDTK